MDPRLKAIGTPQIRSEVGELVRLALAALDELRKIDDGLYDLFVASRSAPVDPARAANQLRELWAATFRAFATLLGYLRRLTGQVAAGEDVAPAELDFGDFEPAEEKSFDLDLGAIGELVEGLDAGAEARPEAERWAETKDKLATIAYGLRSQVDQANERREVALAAGSTGQVLGVLDDTSTAASEGIHALVSAVYAAFVPDVDPATVVPEYLTTLKRALVVRRGLAELAATLGPLNDALQAAPASEGAAVLASIRSTLHGFVISDTCRAMRPADRWELVQFDQQLAGEPPAAARQTTEGLVKYLESLGAINQREVLVLHDQRVLGELRDASTNARELMELSPPIAHELLVKACHRAGALRGKHPAIDQLLDRLGGIDLASTSPAQSPALLERLDQLRAAAGG